MSTYRRRFLQVSAALVAVAPLRTLFAQGAPQCGLTGEATEGPFFVANMPLGSQINTRGMRGTPMHVTGLVLAADGKSPLAAAKVELWHADADGNYHPAGNGDMRNYRPEQLNLRGTVLTDAQGRFQFDSIVPAFYGNRRRHLHWKISARGHRTLTTQTYWASERGHPSTLRDFVDRNSEACRWLDFRNDAKGVATGHFTVFMGSA